MNNVLKSQKAKDTMDDLAWWLERGEARKQNVLQFKIQHMCSAMKHQAGVREAGLTRVL